MGRVQRWLLVGAVVAVAAFVLGLLGGITGTSPIQLVPASESPSSAGS